MCEWGDTVVLPLPGHIHISKINRSVSADKCMEDLLKYLWKNGIQTLAHCCGHNDHYSHLGDKLSIVITDGYDGDGIKRIARLIQKVESRPFIIQQWRLNIVYES